MNKILVISGPTASGKTELALDCAEKFGGEIISCDSMQIYKLMDVGTGKIKEQEMRNIPHHMLDIIFPDKEFSVNDYVELCDQTIQNLSSKNKLPIIVGGTGLYINGILNGMNFAQVPKSDEIRRNYMRLKDLYGNEHLYNLLKNIDPLSAEKINVNDIKRIIRALEIFDLSGTIKSQAAIKNTIEKYDYKFFVLSPKRELLYQNINNRVEQMFFGGLVEEVKNLVTYKNCQSMQAIGYKELIEFIEGRITENEAKEKVKFNSRHYAKRQITYLKHLQNEKTWMDDYKKTDNALIFNIIKEFL